MDVQWVGAALTALALAVALAAFILSGLRGLRKESQGIRQEIQQLARQHREDFRDLSQRQREDFRVLIQQQREDSLRMERAIKGVEAKLAETTERTAHIEGILAQRWKPDVQAVAAQAVPGGRSDEQ